MSESKQSARGGRRLPWIVLGLLAVLIAPAWWTLTSPDTLPIKHVQVRSSFRHFHESEIKSIVMPFVETGLMAVKSRRLMERLSQEPWVQDAKVSRLWPDGLKIEIKEKIPVAYWGETALLMNDGVIFKPPANTPAMKLPLLKGPDDQTKRVLQVYENISRILAPTELGVKRLKLSSTLSWSLELSNGITVILGREEPVQQVERLQKVYRRIIGDRAGEVEQLDLRYPRGMTVRWRKAA